jgi:hypothetical protein
MQPKCPAAAHRNDLVAFGQDETALRFRRFVGSPFSAAAISAKLTLYDMVRRWPKPSA